MEWGVRVGGGGWMGGCVCVCVCVCVCARARVYPKVTEVCLIRDAIAYSNRGAAQVSPCI